VTVEMIPDGDGTVTLHGPPVTVEMQQVFGSYAGGAQVTGLVLLKDGVKVVYADGSDYLFVAVPDGSTLMARPDGKLEVKGPADTPMSGGDVLRDYAEVLREACAEHFDAPAIDEVDWADIAGTLSRHIATSNAAGSITPEWCLRMAELEGDTEIGAGSPDHPLRTGIVPSSNAAGGDEVERLRSVVQAVDDAAKGGADTVALLVELGRIGKLARAALSNTGGDSRG
jgi:hypothetical protein